MDELLKWWPVFTFGAVNIFALGVMWWKVESARQAVNILFKKTDDVQTHTTKHCTEIEGLDKRFEKFEKDSLEHKQEASKRYAALVIRIDQIYTEMTKRA